MKTLSSRDCWALWSQRSQQVVMESIHRLTFSGFPIVLRRGPSCWCDIDADEGRLHDAADGCCDCRGTIQHAVRRLLALRSEESI